MTVYNISYRDNLPDSVFRSIINTATNNNIQIINFIKNKSLNIKANKYSGYTTTFKSNSEKPKSYTRDSDKLQYNIDTLNTSKNNFPLSRLDSFNLSAICSATDEDCAVCDDNPIEPIECQWGIDFDPMISVTTDLVPGVNNNWFITKEDMQDNPLNQSNSTINFVASCIEVNDEFSIDIYIKTNECKEKTYNFYGTNTITDSFTTPIFGSSEDYIVEFIFTITTNDCVGTITYYDDQATPSCTTTPTPTITPTPTL